MRLKLNLATQPYAEVRQFIFRSTLLLVVMVAITAALVFFAVSSLRGWNEARREQAAVQAKIAERDQLREQAQNYLNQPQNRETRDKSRFLNELIARKAFSWTEVFSDLEKIMPTGLHVVSVSPSINDNNQIEVKLTVNGRSRDRAIELVKQLENSKHFRLAQIINEQSANAGQAGAGGGGRAGLQPGDLAQFQISAVYLPAPPTAAAAIPPSAGKGATTTGTPSPKAGGKS